jgi:PEGA domain
VTGAPIYLVSACTSGEEFVAAFRRYADKNGLFIPIGEPLPPGGRSRFAVTLRDGGVMIEGEAEIVSSARVPSVMHGRVGMTLRFVQPDNASRTTLSELEKARLAMKPAPPSVPPRPAEIPAEPRPVPPPVQGRIDAVNALAECVAIGDVSVLGPPLPPVALPPPKPGPRFVMPAIPAARAAPGTSPPGTLGVAPRPAAAPRASTAPLPIAIPRPDDHAAAELPAVTPRATPQPDRLRSAERAAAPDPVSGLSQTMTAIEVAPGPPSDTMVAVSPPPPPPATLPAEPSLLPEASARFDRGPMSATMTAVPVPSANPPSAPTVIGGPVVPVDDDDSARTQIHAGAPRPTPAPGAPGPAMPRADVAPLHADAPPTQPPVDVAQTLRDPPLRTLERRPAPQVSVTMHGMPLELRPPAPPLPDIEIAEPTDISMPPEPPSSPSAELPTEPAPSTEPEAAALVSAAMPSAEVGAAALVSAAMPSAEIDTAEPAVDEAPSTARSAEPSGPQSIEPPPEDAGAPPRPSSVQIETLEIQESDAITHELSAEPEPDAATARPRRTVVGVAVQPTGVLIPPAPVTRRVATRAALPAGPDEPTAILAGDPAVDAAAPTVPPGSDQLSAAEPPPSEPAPAAPVAISNGLPSGDWTIALDPAAPDGWSPPRHAVPRPPLAGIPAAPALAEPATPDDTDVATPAARRLRPGEMPAVEPKVQIDPTLIEPVHALPGASSPDLAGSAPELARYAPEPGREAVEAPALHMMMAVPQPGPYAPPHGSPMHGGQPPGYPLEPPYARMPGGLPPGLAAPDGNGFGAVRYPPMPSQVRRRHLVILLVTAVVAVLLGIAAVLLFRRPPSPVSPGSQVDDRPGGIETPAPGESPRGPDSPPSGDPGAAPPGAAPAGAAGTAPPGTPPAASGSGEPDPPHAAAPAAAHGDCYADVSSVPAGAEIVLDQASVIGTTPQRIALPCGHPVELLVRKPHLVPSTHTITPTPEGAAVQFVLVRQTFLVKVSSTPPGATVTLGSKSLGVTPTMVKVPAFESSTLSIAKDGYETESETVAPRGNGTAVHTVLKKADHKKPR